MTRPEALEAIHRALLSQGISDRDVHEYLDWIEDDTRQDWRMWWLLSAGMGLLGLVTGGFLCLVFR
jgi:hypothetical protein